MTARIPLVINSGAIQELQGGDSFDLGTGATLVSPVITGTGTAIFSQVNIVGQGDLRLEDTTGGEYVALQAPTSLASSYTLTLPNTAGASGQALITDGAGNLSWSTAASGDVYGPASATDNAVSRFDGTTGKIIQNSGVIIDDSNNVTGVADFTNTGNTTLGNASTDTVTVNGYMGVGALATTAALNVETSAMTGTGQRGIRGQVTFGSAATNSGYVFSSGPSTAAASFTLPTLAGFYAFDVATKGAGSTITNLHGVYIADQTQGTNNYGITSAVSSGSNKWNIYASGTAQNYFAGNVGIGTSSPSYGQVEATGNFNVKANSSGWLYRKTRTDGSWGAGIYDTDGYGTLAFYTAATERMRIDSSGNLLVGTTSKTYSAVGACISPTGYSYITKSDTPPLELNRLTSNGNILTFGRESVVVGSVSVTTTATTYNTSSDYRLKENIQPMQNALARNALLKPCTYSWKADGSTGEGFIAHELQAVCPDAVTGEKDAVDKDGKPVYQGVDTSFLVGHLVACINELKAELDATKAEVAALKGV